MRLQRIELQKVIFEGEIWLVDFPLEEDPTQFYKRPVIVLNVDFPDILSTKVTKHVPRKADPFDTPIRFWKDANLDFPSIARVSKTIPLKHSDFRKFIGIAHIDDLMKIQEEYTEFFFNNF